MTDKKLNLIDNYKEDKQIIENYMINNLSIKNN